MTARLYLLQRASAAVLAPLVLVHLGVIIYAVRAGLSAEEILARTSGSLGWGLFYTLFVLAVAVHGGIGLQNISREWFRLSPAAASLFGHAFMVVALLLGLRAVYAVVAT